MVVHCDEVSSDTAQKGDKKTHKEITIGRKGEKRQKEVPKDFWWTTMLIADFTSRY